VLTVLRLRGRHPVDRVVIAFPDFPRYRSLAAETATTLRTVDIEVWFAGESGEVRTYD